MDKFDILVCTSAGVEAVTKRELYKLGITDCPATDGRLAFKGDLKTICDCNVSLRTADRVLIKIAEFGAQTFDDLFDGIFAIDWRDWVAVNQRVVVSAKSVKSKLFALSSIQSLGKKAIVEKLKKAYKVGSVDENGTTVKIEISLKNDVVTVCIDSSGDGLHKRGYRDLVGAAPLKETLAAAMIMFSVWNPDRPFVDLFCGSGTLPIEATMIGLNIAPNVNRDFAVQNFKFFEQDVLDEVRLKARDSVVERPLRIMGFDIDKNAISLSMRHAKRAGVQDYIHFQRQDFKDFSSKDRYGVIVSNPPYGERLMTEKEVRFLYKDLHAKFATLNDWSMGVLTSYYNFEKVFGKKADKNRKFFNSNLECHFYQYLGARPPKKQRDENQD
ncbi:MAG: class I SAM-dependent RNA methyltransferase [Clostridia bacterium]|nr:class I SAM-dependent RNA methyltransferase [Clostridia bacterium]